MGLRKGQASYARFRFDFDERPKDVRRWLARGFRKQVFEPLEQDGDVDRSAGWVEFDNPDETELSPGSLVYGEYVLLGYRVDAIRVPSQVLNAKVEAWLREYEAANARRPKRAEIRETKELLHRRLRRRAFPMTRVYEVSWHLETDVVQIWATSRKIIEEIQISLEDAFSAGLVEISVSNLAEKLGYDPEALEPTAALLGAFDDSEVSGYVGA